MSYVQNDLVVVYFSWVAQKGIQIVSENNSILCKYVHILKNINLIKNLHDPGITIVKLMKNDDFSLYCTTDSE